MGRRCYVLAGFPVRLAGVSGFTTAVLVLLPSLVQQGPLADVEPREADLALWRQHLEPTGRELRWESIPWAPTFREGLLQADRLGRPLLLWTMNGHPLGCT